MADDAPDMSERKRDHIRISLDEASSQFDRRSTLLERAWFENEALPEMALSDVDLSVEFLGKRLAAPIIVSSMTGGPHEGAKINKHLALGCAAAGLGMGVGSQRIALADPTTRSSFEVRAHAPGILLLGNLGAVQLNYGYGAKEAREAVAMIGADGLFLHLNALQEAVQPEGDTDFRGLLDRIGALVKEVDFPILIKEVGAGISPKTLRALWSRGVAAVDVSGAGGTSWSRIEGRRASDAVRRAVGETFANWGIPTAVAIEEGRRAVPAAKIIGSGGIRTGLDIAKALALGADIVSVAHPLLAPSLESGDAVSEVLERLIAELRVACFATGSRTVADLRRPGLLRKPVEAFQ